MQVRHFQVAYEFTGALLPTGNLLPNRDTAIGSAGSSSATRSRPQRIDSRDKSMDFRLVAYRAAAFCTVLLAISIGVVSGQDEFGFVSLFDGQTLTGWRAFQQQDVSANWSVQDEAIRGDGNGPDLLTIQRFEDFDLRFEWRIETGGNSGVIYRVQEADTRQPYESGIEYQVVDEDRFHDGISAINSSAAIYGLYGETEKVLRDVGTYNTARIVVRGNHLEHWLNGELVTSAVIGSEDWNKRLAASKFAKWPWFAKSKRGHIALQAHGGVIWYRNLRIHDLTNSAKPESP